MQEKIRKKGNYFGLYKRSSKPFRLNIPKLHRQPPFHFHDLTHNLHTLPSSTFLLFPLPISQHLLIVNAHSITSPNLPSLINRQHPFYSLSQYFIVNPPSITSLTPGQYHIIVQIHYDKKCLRRILCPVPNCHLLSNIYLPSIQHFFGFPCLCFVLINFFFQT